MKKTSQLIIIACFKNNLHPLPPPKYLTNTCFHSITTHKMNIMGLSNITLSHWNRWLFLPILALCSSRTVLGHGAAVQAPQPQDPTIPICYMSNLLILTDQTPCKFKEIHKIHLFASTPLFLFICFCAWCDVILSSVNLSFYSFVNFFKMRGKKIGWHHDRQSQQVYKTKAAALTSTIDD